MHLHPFWHFWMLSTAAFFGWLSYRYHRAPRRDAFNVGVAAVICVAILFAWSGLSVFGTEPARAAKTPSRAERMADRYKKAGVVCAEDMDNDSGNVCRVRVGDQECVTVLPDDDTKTSLGRGELTRCAPAKATR